jgi:hypothetical protein
MQKQEYDGIPQCCKYYVERCGSKDFEVKYDANTFEDAAKSGR